MAQTPAQKKAVAKWQAANMITIGVKMRRDDAEKLSELARANGTTRNAILLEAAREYISKYNQSTADQEAQD